MSWTGPRRRRRADGPAARRLRPADPRGAAAPASDGAAPPSRRRLGGHHKRPPPNLAGRHFVERFAFEISEEDLDKARWRGAWAAVVARHDALRTAFDVRALEGRVVEVDASSIFVDGDGDVAALADRAARDVAAALTNGSAPLLRVGFRGRVAVVAASHLVVDGASMAVLLDDLTKAYRGAVLNPAPAWAAHARRALAAADDAKVRDYVRSTLGDAPTTSASKPFTAAPRRWRLALPGLAAKIDVWAKGRGVSTAAVVHAAFAVARDFAPYLATVAARADDVVGPAFAVLPACDPRRKNVAAPSRDGRVSFRARRRTPRRRALASTERTGPNPVEKTLARGE